MRCPPGLAGSRAGTFIPASRQGVAMAAANVTVTIEGLDELTALVERIEAVVTRVEATSRPLFGDVRISSRDGVRR